QRHDREPGQADATQPVRGWGRPRHGDGNLLRPLPSTHATSLTCVSRRQPLNRGKALRPAYTAAASSSSSMRSSWLYLATRSERAGAPVLIWPQSVATARSAMVVSSVSPERCDMTAE